MNPPIKSVVLKLEPETFEVITEAVFWYHESLHMLTDPGNYDPELPLEQLDKIAMVKRIIRMHRLLKEFNEVTAC